MTAGTKTLRAYISKWSSLKLIYIYNWFSLNYSMLKNVKNVCAYENKFVLMFTVNVNVYRFPWLFFFFFNPCRYDEYLKSKIHCSDLQQPSLSQFIVPQTSTYPVNHPRQKAFIEAIISDLIINCNMPLSITDNKHFIHFLSIMDTKCPLVY